MRLEPLKNAYSRGELMTELRSNFRRLSEADEKGTTAYPDSYDLRIKDRGEARGQVSQTLPFMFGDVLVDAQLEPGVWKNSFFVVIRPNDHQTILRQGSYSGLDTGELEEVVLYAGQMSPSYTRFSQGPLPHFGIRWGEEPLAEPGSSAASRQQSQERIEAMTTRARALVESGGNQAWGFRQSPLANPANQPVQNVY